MAKSSKSKLTYILLLLVLGLGVYSHQALAASLSLSSTTSAYSTGQSFKVVVFVSSSDQAINAVSGTVNFPTDTLSVASVSTSGSIITNWVSQPSFSNSSGTVHFEGIVYNPGFTGSNGDILTINFKAISTGSAALSISDGSVLANDGSGTNVFSGSSGETIGITPAVTPPAAAPSAPASSVTGEISIASSSHPDPTKWYSNADISLSWSRPSNVYGYSFTLDQKPDTVPDNSLDTTVTTTKAYTNLKDGIWYFHIKGRPQSSSSSFGPTSTFKVSIDTAPPAAFELGSSGSTVTFTTTDQLSGIDHFEALADNQVVSENVSSPYTFVGLKPGLRNVQIIAFDKAGNQTSASASVEITGNQLTSFWTQAVGVPWYLLLLMNLIILILLVVIVWLLLIGRKGQGSASGEAIDELQSDIDNTLKKLRNEIDSRLVELNAKSLDELVQKESKIAKAISSDIKKTKTMINKKIDQASKKK